MRLIPTKPQFLQAFARQSTGTQHDEHVIFARLSGYVQMPTPARISKEADVQAGSVRVSIAITCGDGKEDNNKAGSHNTFRISIRLARA